MHEFVATQLSYGGAFCFKKKLELLNDEGEAGVVVYFPGALMGLAAKVGGLRGPQAWAVPASEWLGVFASLALIIGASSGIFWLLIRRWTTQRHWLALQDWADENRFKLHGEKGAVGPEVLRSITQPAPKILVSLNDVDTGIVQIEAEGPRGSGMTQVRWNLLVRKLERAWPTTGFRPASSGRSILDYFPLNEMRAMAPTERFVLYGAEARTARALGKSSVAALLPPDVGLLLVERNLVLDFSGRPFDPLELERVDALAEQIVGHLP